MEMAVPVLSGGCFYDRSAFKLWFMSFTAQFEGFKIGRDLATVRGPFTVRISEQERYPHKYHAFLLPTVQRFGSIECSSLQSAQYRVAEMFEKQLTPWEES